MKSKKIKLSIVVIIYNMEKYLPRCLDTLVNQTLQEIEIICVNDGSTDNSPNIIKQYQEKYPNKVKIYHKQNGGEFTARSYGLERATGEYVGFIDSDDYVELTWAEKLYDAVKENDADLAVSGYERINSENGKLITTEMARYGNCIKYVLPNDDFIAYINTALWNKVIKRNKVKDLQFFHVKGYNDAMFLMMAYTRIEKIVLIEDILYHYCIRYDSQIHNINKSDIDKLKKYLLEVKKMYEINNKYEEMEEHLSLMAFIHLGISAIYRASYHKEIDIKKTIKETKQYLDKNFPTWRKNKFLKLTNCYNKGLRPFGLYVANKLYKLNLEMLFIRTYRFFIDKLGIDIKS